MTVYSSDGTPGIERADRGIAGAAHPSNPFRAGQPTNAEAAPAMAPTSWPYRSASGVPHWPADLLAPVPAAGAELSLPSAYLSPLRTQSPHSRAEGPLAHTKSNCQRALLAKQPLYPIRWHNFDCVFNAVPQAAAQSVVP